MRKILAFFTAAAALALICGCSGKKGESAKTVIQNKGSDTMVNIAQAWAEAYKKASPEIEIEVSGGGSGVGIAALSKGAVDIANSSRNLKKKEIEDALASTGKEPVETIVGYDALAIYINKDNPLETISMEQIAEIYKEGGSITKWSDLGVTMPPKYDNIIRVSRQSSSGTYEFLRGKVLKNVDFKLGSCDLNGSKEVVELVSNTPSAIGYSGMGYTTRGVKMLKVIPAAGKPPVEPTQETTLDKSYPISRSLLVCTLGQPEGAVKNYIDWLLSNAGQAILKENGFVPTKPLSGDK